MKKVLTIISAAIAAVVIAVLFAACSANYAGTYKFSSMSMDMGGATVEINAGEEFQGVTLTEDAIVLEIKDDETWTMTTNIGGAMTQTGTWTTSDGGIVLTGEDGSEITATVSGNTITISETYSGTTQTITLKK